MRFRNIAISIAVLCCMSFTASAKGVSDTVDMLLDQFVGELLAEPVMNPQAPVAKTEPNNIEKTPEAMQAAKSKDIIKATEDSKNLRQDLRKSSLAPLDETTQQYKDSDLMRMIDQIRSLNFVDQKESPEKDKPTEEKVAESIKTEEIAVEDPATKKGGKQVVIEPVETAKTNILPDHPEEIVDARQLAETLFLAGRKKEAAKYYQLVLKRLGNDYSASNIDREWILFQLGNCLYETDAQTAEKIYEQFMREYPSSDWVRCASVKRQILKWKIKDKPEEIAKPVIQKLVRKQTIISAK